MRYKRIGYNVDVLRQSACLVVNQITVNNFAVLFNCMPLDRGSDSMIAPIYLFGWLDFCHYLADRGPSGGLLLLQCFSGVADAQRISRCLSAL